MRIDTVPAPAGVADPSPIARAAGDLVWLSGVYGAAPVALSGAPLAAAGDAQQQATRAVGDIAARLSAAGTSVSQLAKATTYVRSHGAHVVAVALRDAGAQPARASVAPGDPWGVLVPASHALLDVVAARSGARLGRPAREDAQGHEEGPAAVTTGDFVFPAAHGAMALGAMDRREVSRDARKDPDLPFHGSDIERQTRFALEQLRRTLQAVGSDLPHVLSAHVFMLDLLEFPRMDHVWREFFGEHLPARTTVKVKALPVPGMRVLIDAIAVKATAPRVPFTSARIPRPLANYAPGVRTGDYLFCAGQIASDYVTGLGPSARVDPAFPFYSVAIAKQTDYILGNFTALLEDNGSGLGHVVKANVFLTRADDYYEFDQAWRRHFTQLPARTVVQVMAEGLLVKDTLVEIELIAVAK